MIFSQIGAADRFIIDFKTEQEGDLERLASQEVTELLQAWSSGDKLALDRLVPLVYDELHRLAHSYVARERTDPSLQTTALVNEAYLKLVKISHVRWQDRAHFFGISANVMRRILVDIARSRNFQKRGGKLPKVPIAEAVDVSSGPAPGVIELDDALNALAAIDARRARVVELRFFGGLEIREIAEVMKVSADTVMRDWRLAKAWLHKELSREKS